MTDAYCVKCRERVDMDNEEEVTMRNGKKAIKGSCSMCGTTLFRIKPSPKPDYW